MRPGGRRWDSSGGNQKSGLAHAGTSGKAGGRGCGDPAPGGSGRGRKTVWEYLFFQLYQRSLSGEGLE